MTISILPMRKLSHRKIKGLAPCHTACKGGSLDLNPNRLSPESRFLTSVPSENVLNILSTCSFRVLSPGDSNPMGLCGLGQF